MAKRFLKTYSKATQQKARLAFTIRAFLINGADTKSRTRDLLITSQLLYQLSYVGTSGGAFYGLDPMRSSPFLSFFPN